MALQNLLPRTSDINGSDCTGSDGATSRTYTIPNTDITSQGLNIVVNGRTLVVGDFTLSGSIITFVNAIFDDNVIRINYFITFGSAALSTSTSLKYSTPLMLAQIIGVDSDIPSWDVAATPTNEAVGTGDDLNTTFYLDQKSVIADSYILYANAVAMTETTHYDLDNDTGTIVLTSAGVTLLSTKDLTAKYSYYSIGMKDSYIQSVLARAEKEVDKATNSTFTDGTATNPAYPVKTEIQSSPGYFRDQIIIGNKPLIDIESTLDGDITDSQNTIDLASGEGTNFPTSGNVVIGSEVVSYTGISTDQLTGVTRGVLGSTAATHSDGDAVHSTILFMSNTPEGTAVTWTVQPWDTSMYTDDTGLFYSFADSIFSGAQSTERLNKQDVANRVRIIYRYGYNTLPADITRLTLLFAKRMLMQDNVGASMIKGRNEFKPEMMNADKDEINRIINSYIVLAMGNT